MKKVFDKFTFRCGKLISNINQRDNFYGFYLILIGLSSSVSFSQTSSDSKIVLGDNWFIQSSAEVRAGGQEISIAGFQPETWYPSKMPATVLAALVANGVYPDPYFGTNINKIPGAITMRNR